VKKASHPPTQVGDVLILGTTQSYRTFAVGPVLTNGQHDFHGQSDVTYLRDEKSAVILARTRVGAKRDIFLVDIDSGDWRKLA
jgi:hypothetical protein